jgi:hypothetical protein
LEVLGKMGEEGAGSHTVGSGGGLFDPRALLAVLAMELKGQSVAAHSKNSLYAIARRRLDD